jgi:hypothetical protein
MLDNFTRWTDTRAVTVEAGTAREGLIAQDVSCWMTTSRTPGHVSLGAATAVDCVEFGAFASKQAAEGVTAADAAALKKNLFLRASAASDAVKDHALSVHVLAHAVTPSHTDAAGLHMT